MAKGTVKGINTGMQGGSSSVGITVTPTGGGGSLGTTYNQPSSNPPGQIMSGTIQDNANPQLTVNFSQAFGAELGLVANSKVFYTTVNVGGQVIANTVRLLQRGEILIINADNTTGTLMDKATGTIIPFAQAYAHETGLIPASNGTPGTKVHFEIIVDPNTALMTAVALEVIGG